jgi:hypothetical protein
MHRAALDAFGAPRRLFAFATRSFVSNKPQLKPS